MIAVIISYIKYQRNIIIFRYFTHGDIRLVNRKLGNRNSFTNTWAGPAFIFIM